MDITKRLNDIILKYNLDECYPEYRKMLRAIELLGQFAKEYEGKKLLCISTSKGDIKKFKHDTGLSLDADYVHVNDIEANAKNFKKRLFVETIPLDTAKDYDAIVIISAVGSGVLKNFFRLNEIEAFSIYDYFEKNDLFLNREYRSFFYDKSEGIFVGWYDDRTEYDPIPFEMYDLNRSLNATCDSDLKAIFFKKLFFLSLISGNLLKASELILDAWNINVCQNQLKAWKDVEELISDIKSVIKKKNTRSIIAYWIDMVDYDGCMEIEYLKTVKERGLWFSNMFTVDPHTTPALKAIMCGATPADDKSYKITNIDENNSPLIRNLNTNGFDFKLKSGGLRQINQKYRSKEFYSSYSPFSQRLWDALGDMCNEERDSFYLIHGFFESHFPCISVGMEDNSVGREYVMLRDGKREISRQLRFYDELYPKEAIRVYFSDHGTKDFHTMFHTFFAVTGKGIKHKVEDGMVSLLSFADMMGELSKKESIDSLKYVREYVPLQDIDYYNGFIIGSQIKARTPIGFRVLGYTGFADKDHIFLKFNSRVKWVSDRKNDENRFPPCLLFDSPYETNEKLIMYEKIIDDSPRPIAEGKSFRYTKYLYDQLNHKASKEYNAKKIDIIIEIFKRLPDTDVAIRMGGEHTKYILGLLKKCGKFETIKYIIDYNPDCLCSAYGITVISPEEFQSKEKEISCVILSSFEFINDLRRESKKYNAEVIDIYASLSKEGIRCRSEFYEFEPLEEAYDLDFPFGEVGL